MQQLAQELYYGYQRAAQIRLIRNEYDKAFQEYHQGFKKVSNKHGIQLLLKSAVKAQHIFDQVAAELARDRLYDDANGVANSMISLLPTSPVGYLRAGKLYQMQGKIRAAIEVYKQGISSVSADDQTLLIQYKCDLQRQLDQILHYYDIIVQTPLEIASSIAQYLSVRDLLECLKVSKSWKERIEQCPEAWRALNVEDDDGYINISVIKHVKQFVRQVIIESDAANSPLVKDLLVSIANGEFESLTHLGLEYGTIDAQYIPYLNRICNRVNLTRLDLTFCSSMPQLYIPLHQVLGSCPRLKRLKYHTDSFAMKIDYDLSSQEPTAITHLSIGAFSYFQERHEKPHFFIPLIPVFPHLVDLYKTYSSPGDLQTIAKECLNLRRLVVAMQDDYEAFQDFPDTESTLHGLQYLRIDGYVDPYDVASVIAQNSETLISIHVELHCENDRDGQLVDPNWSWKHIPKLDCPVLKKLQFVIHYYWPFERWIGDCPVLEDISLAGVTELTDSIFDAFRRLPKLRLLELEDCRGLTDDGFSGFFNDIQNQGSHLHTVILRYCDSLSTATLLSLFALPSLRNLCIHSCNGVTETVFQDFASNVNGNSSIESVSFRCLNGLTPESLLQLIHALPNLLSLNLHYIRNITDDTISTIANTWPGMNISKN